MTFDDDFHLLSIDVTFGDILPLEEMTSPIYYPLYSQILDFEENFGVLVLYFYFVAILGVCLRPIYLL
jgi:hypothetical protein